MKHTFRWALLLATLLSLPGWIAESEDELEVLRHHEATKTLLSALKAVLAGPTALAFVLFSRVEPEKVLQQETRRRIHTYVLNNPGSSMSEVADAVGVGWGTVVHHLERLERANALRSHQDGRRRVFLPPGPTSTLGVDHFRRTAPALARLLDAVAATPGSSQKRLAESAGLSLSLANRHLQRLERAGLVASTKTWRTRTYSLPQTLGSQFSQMENRTHSGLSAVSPRGTRWG